MDKNYGGVIWTNHALQRLKERGIKQGDAWATWRNPQQERYAQSQGAWIYYRTYGSTKIEVVAKKNEKGEWMILSVWAKQVYEKQNYRDQKPKSLLQLILRRLFKMN